MQVHRQIVQAWPTQPIVQLLFIFLSSYFARPRFPRRNSTQVLKDTKVQLLRSSIVELLFFALTTLLLST
jgi:hypothetical protein